MEEVGTKWKDIGYQIDISPRELEEMGRKNSIDECCEKVLSEWLNEQGANYYPVTWEGLYLLLRDVNAAKEAECLKEAVAKSGNYIQLNTDHAEWLLYGGGLLIEVGGTLGLY